MKSATKPAPRKRVPVVAAAKPAVVERKSRLSPAAANAIRNFRAAIAYLDGTYNYEKMVRTQYNETKFNLARMQRLLSMIGNPHKAIPAIHIAGTKGKGSTCHMLASMLQKAGHKVGLYTSPHFVDIRERIVVNGSLISESTFAKLIDRLAGVASSMSADPPTFFEYLTAAAFLHFAEQNVAYAVLEVGLGGRLDATNVCQPLVCGITNISYDHMQQLGHRIEQIAEEKAGIFKPGIPVIAAPQPIPVKKVLKRVAAKVGTDLKFIGNEIEFSYRFEASRSSGPHTRICMNTPNSRFDHLQVPLLGEHQAFNCGVAVGIIDTLRAMGHKITEQHAIDGLDGLRIEGRLEQVKTAPRTIVDAAHNAASVRALMKAIGQNIGYDSMVVIFGCAGDKDIDGMMTQLQLGADKVIFTSIPSPRSADPKELLARFVEKSGKMAQLAPNLEQAYQIAQSCVTREDLVCITGSVYLVGEAKRLLAAGRM
ncbi:MAG: folylpolyglutamate synthase/dihydrofolate synthase family protein [Phycisphaerae bacterium]|nr:folylpolyglutamate synthase/dihydrofolate synthase family protein [Phycisphaerae bacterium]